jgi:hypothetical protein
VALCRRLQRPSSTTPICSVSYRFHPVAEVVYFVFSQLNEGEKKTASFVFFLGVVLTISLGSLSGLPGGVEGDLRGDEFPYMGLIYSTVIEVAGLGSRFFV